MNTPITESVRRTLDEMQLSSLEEAYQYCMDRGIDPKALVMDTQPIAFESAADAYTLGTALAIFRVAKTAEEAANIIGEGLQACTKPGSVAEQRRVGIGHGALAARLLNEESGCFAFLAGHESFAAAEGAIKIALNVNKSRKKPLKVILNGLGKDAA
ncbi:GGGtGRT protein, partial [Vibrio alginolyticus]|uniref:GGGtGRT protein n=1 Tax=Vibrio TaxID=662 RepID=UPI001CDD89BC